MKELAHFGRVVEREDKLTIESPEEPGEFTKVGFGEIEVVVREPPIRWIKIEQVLAAVVALDDLLIRK